MNGRMWIEVAQPFDDFAKSIEPVIELKTSIAEDCNIEPHYVWVLFPMNPVPERTQFIVFLPNSAKKRYLKIPPEERKGKAVAAGSFEPDSSDVIHINVRLFQITSIASEIANYSSPLQFLTRGILTVPQTEQINMEVSQDIKKKENQVKTAEKAISVLGKEASQMTDKVEHYVVVGSRTIPIVAFFGTKGGVGKTTIVDKFSTLVSRADKAPNILMVDFDIHHRGLTVLRTKDRFEGSRTIHEYLANDQLEFHGAQDVTPLGNFGTQGREFLIPSSNLAAEHVYKSLNRLNPTDLIKRLTNLLNAAATRYNIDLILVDCGPIVDPLTASAAYMSDMAFIIGQNEPITFQSLQNYAIRIHDFLPDFNASKVRVILNKVRGLVLQKAGIYATIPFTMEVVDFSEGLLDIDEIRLIYLDYCVHGIIKSVFREGYDSLVPGSKAVFTSDQRKVIDTIDYYTGSKRYLGFRKKVIFLYAGCGLLLLALTTFLLPKFIDIPAKPILQWLKEYLPEGLCILGIILGGFGAFFYSRLRQASNIIRFKQKEGYEGLLRLLTTRKGRKKFNEIQKLSKKFEKEA